MGIPRELTFLRFSHISLSRRKWTVAELRQIVAIFSLQRPRLNPKAIMRVLM
jgi:hypothetical protein